MDFQAYEAQVCSYLTDIADIGSHLDLPKCRSLQKMFSTYRIITLYGTCAYSQRSSTLQTAVLQYKPTSVVV